MSKDNFVESTPFSDFIRNASLAEKTRVYMGVMRQANDAQNRIIEAAKLKREQLGEVG